MLNFLFARSNSARSVRDAAASLERAARQLLLNAAEANGHAGTWGSLLQAVYSIRRFTPFFSGPLRAICTNSRLICEVRVMYNQQSSVCRL